MLVEYPPTGIPVRPTLHFAVSANAIAGLRYSLDSTKLITLDAEGIFKIWSISPCRLSTPTDTLESKGRYFQVDKEIPKPRPASVPQPAPEKTEIDPALYAPIPDVQKRPMPLNTGKYTVLIVDDYQWK
jgi:hypothetical protein